MVNYIFFTCTWFRGEDIVVLCWAFIYCTLSPSTVFVFRLCLLCMAIDEIESPLLLLLAHVGPISFSVGCHRLRSPNTPNFNRFFTNNAIRHFIQIYPIISPNPVVLTHQWHYVLLLAKDTCLSEDTRTYNTALLLLKLRLLYTEVNKIQVCDQNEICLLFTKLVRKIPTTHQLSVNQH